MLFLRDEDSHGWQRLLREMLPSGYDMKPPGLGDETREGFVDEVREVIRAALTSANETNFLPRPKHSLDKYVEQYWRTRDRRLGPIIPTFVRVYCAATLGRKYSAQMIAPRNPRRPAREAPPVRQVSEHRQEPVLRMPAAAVRC
jgi:hypothetical protein